MTKFKLSKRIRRRICLYASSAAAVVSGLSILSAIGYCELGVFGVGEMLVRAIVSMILLAHTAYGGNIGGNNEDRNPEAPAAYKQQSCHIPHRTRKETNKKVGDVR